MHKWELKGGLRPHRMRGPTKHLNTRIQFPGAFLILLIIKSYMILYKKYRKSYQKSYKNIGKSSKIILGSFWDRFGVILGSFWGHFGIVSGSFRGSFLPIFIWFYIFCIWFFIYFPMYELPINRSSGHYVTFFNDPGAILERIFLPTWPGPCSPNFGSQTSTRAPGSARWR